MFTCSAGGGVRRGLRFCSLAQHHSPVDAEQFRGSGLVVGRRLEPAQSSRVSQSASVGNRPVAALRQPGPLPPQFRQGCRAGGGEPSKPRPGPAIAGATSGSRTFSKCPRLISSPALKTTARSRTFCNSRTLPGQSRSIKNFTPPPRAAAAAHSRPTTARGRRGRGAGCLADACSTAAPSASAR